MNLSFDIVRGSIGKPHQIQQFLDEMNDYLTGSEDNGTLYLGYPLSANSDTKVTIDAMLVSENHGIVAFIFENKGLTLEELKDEQDSLYYHLDFYLKKYTSLRKGRDTVVKPVVVTVTIDDDKKEACADGYYFSRSNELIQLINKLQDFNSDFYKPLCEALQKVTNIRPKKKRTNVVGNSSKGWIIREIEKGIANLDEWQKKAALEVPEGPQRIRGLAGTGKTIVLALKAAYLHTQHPEWNILVTFYTRSLMQQYNDLIEKFVHDFSGEDPDWEHLQIMHSWGSQSEEGVYYRLARIYNAPIHSFSSAVGKYGRKIPFKGMCDELLRFSNQEALYEPFYDVVMIDEAQDLPSSFFHLLFKNVKHPKRIIWAYDELQNLSSVEMPSIKEMFGVDDQGNSVINIDNVEDEPQRDIILPICYRNPPWILTMAHALGFGLYNKVRSLPFQTFDNPSMWKDIGYSVISGSLDYGMSVTIERNKNANPEYFERLLSKEDSIIAKGFETKEQQYSWVAHEIAKNISQDQLDPDDILVIFPNAYTSKTEYSDFAFYLSSCGVDSFLAGVNSSQDLFRIQGKVTCSGIYRAKGNEAPMVYIINSEYCYSSFEPVHQRNILFTAITRSRAWVRICGVGQTFLDLENEISVCIKNDYRLTFKCPTQTEAKQIRNLNRERTEEERADAARAKIKIQELLDMIEQKRLDTDMVPELETLMNVLKKGKQTDE